MAALSYLDPEPLAQARARGDGVLRCTFTAGPDQRFLDPTGYKLGDGTLAKAVREVEGGIHVVFPRALSAGDVVWM